MQVGASMAGMPRLPSSIERNDYTVAGVDLQRCSPASSGRLACAPCPDCPVLKLVFQVSETACVLPLHATRYATTVGNMDETLVKMARQRRSPLPDFSSIPEGNVLGTLPASVPPEVVS